MRKTIGRIGCAALLLACLAGLLDPPLAQATTPSTDSAKREQTARAIKEYISFLVDEGSAAANDGSCERLKFWIGRLGNFIIPGEVDQYARKRYGVILRPIGEPDLAGPIADYAVVLRADLVRQYYKICGPPEDPYEDDADISFGGGASSVWVPAIPIGTERKGDEEFALTETDDRLTGGSFSVEVTAPLGGGYRGYVNYQFTEADGSSSAHVPEGDRLVAITFPVENPATGTTGIGPDGFGMNITTRTDFQMNDVQFGFSAPLNFFGPSVLATASVGGRYINVDRSDRIGQELIEFSEISQIIRSNLNTDFFGVQFGIDLNNRPFQGSGFVYGASGSVSLLDSQTDGNVRAFVACPLCPEVDDHNFALRVDSDLGISSVALDAQAYIGYRFGEKTTVQMIVTATHFTDMPVMHLAVSPEDDTQIDEDELDILGIMWRIQREF
jgi:hypothetical protein